MLDYVAQVDVRNQHKKPGSTGAKKITAIEALPAAAAAGASPSPLTAPEFLVTSNDSRIRLYSGLELECKFKGLKNKQTQVRAGTSKDGKYVVSGSDDGWVYLWETHCSDQAGRAGKNPCFESFQAHDTTSVCAIFGPSTCSQQLSTVGKPSPAQHVILTADVSGEVKIFCAY